MQKTPPLLRIVIVDDSRTHRLLFNSILKKTGIHCRATELSGGMALTHYVQRGRIHLPDFIFLDLNMPVICGRECLKAIRKKKEFRKTHVVICSSSMYKEDIDLTYKLGADLYIPKSTLSAEALQTVFSLLQPTGITKRNPDTFVLYPHTFHTTKQPAMA